MDALSDVLSALRFSGAVFLDGEFTAPWCVHSRVTREDFPNRIELPPTVVGFHYVIDGEMQVQLDNAPPVLVRAGEMVLLPRNDPHRLASESGIAAAEPDPPVQRLEGGLMRMVYGGGGGHAPRMRLHRERGAQPSTVGRAADGLRA